MAEKVELLATKAGEAAPAPLILTEAEFVRRYAGEHCEWVGGVVVPMAAASIRHKRLIRYLTRLFETYLDERPIGEVIDQTFVMRLETPERISRREPDIMIVLNTHRDRLHDTYLDGPADLVVEVVSPESYARDHGEKVVEYEAGGVPEYWIIDPERREARFFQLDPETLKYTLLAPTDNRYRTPLLPYFHLDIVSLWATDYPGPKQITAMIQAMLEST